MFEAPEPAKPALCRRRTLRWAAALPLFLPAASRAARGMGAGAGTAGPPAGNHATPRPLDTAGFHAACARLERAHDRRLGLYAIDTGNGRTVGYRAGERFAFCSTFKALLAGAILARLKADAGILDRRILYTRHDLVPYSPITEKHAGGSMTVADLCAAALQYSDNTAANLLLHAVGGPAALTGYARALGNRSFRLDRYEPALNSAIPGDPRDTVTPADMAASLRSLAVGNALTAGGRERLPEWLLGNTTGANRIQAGAPAGWRVGDKTGTGDYGAANDIAIVWAPDRPPIVLAVYTAASATAAAADEPLIAAATQLAIGALG
nr:class A beta-lactamase [Bordetella genomosp. 9]